MSLTLSEIIAAKDSQIEKVPVPEWGGDVFVRVLTGPEREEYDTLMLSKIDGNKWKDNKGLKQLLLKYALCDEKGTRMVQDSDVAKLFGKSSTVLQRLFEKAQQI